MQLPQNLLDSAQLAIDASIKRGASSAEAIVRSARDLTVQVRNQSTEALLNAEETSIGLRVFVGNQSATVSCESINASNLDEIIERCLAMARLSPANPFDHIPNTSELLRSAVPDLQLHDDHEPDGGELTQLAMECEAACIAHSRDNLTDGAQASWQEGYRHLLTSKGFSAGYSSSLYSLSAKALASDNGQKTTDYDYDVTRRFSDLRAPADIGETAAQRANDQLGSQKFSSRTVDAIFTARAARGLIENLTHALLGSLVARKSSFLARSLGEQAVATALTVTDDPTIIKGIASRPFDGEGRAAGPLAIVETGIVKSFALDSATALELSLKPNGRATRAGIGPACGWTNIRVDAGEHSLADMIASCKNGVLIDGFIGHGVDYTTGDYSRAIHGHLISNGELTEAVNEMVLAGNLSDMLKRVILANEVVSSASMACPALMIEGMSLAGK